MNYLEISSGKVAFSERGLTIKGKLPYNEWEEIGKSLRQAEGAIQFWIGDWLNYGEQKYGEMYAQALDNTDCEYQTLRNYKYVADRVELSLRKDNLSFNHHATVAPLEPEEQVRWQRFYQVSQHSGSRRSESHPEHKELLG